jgi:hypothetical protein
MTPSRHWLQIYKQVSREMLMPARGPRGSAINQTRQWLARKIFCETQRRAGKETY